MKFFYNLIKNKVFLFGFINNNKYIETFLKARKRSNTIIKMESDNNKNDEETLPFEILNNEDKNNKTKQNIKNNEKNQTFKITKKLAQGIKVLCHNEKKSIEQLCEDKIHKNLFVIHFGNGDEDDYAGLSSFLAPFGQHKLHIFPGISYGFLEFSEKIQTEKLLSQSKKIAENGFANYIEIPFINKTKHVFFFPTALNFSDLNKCVAFNFPNADDTFDSIKGLKIIPDFIDENEEKLLIKQIDLEEWTKLANRRVQHYGYEFLYGINSIDKNKKALKPIPEFLQTTMNKINKLTEGIQPPMDQLTINDYSPGDGIPPHFDTHSPFEEIFVALSLGSGITMSFKSFNNEERHIYIPQRGLIVFSDEARYAWYHSIAQRKVDKTNGKLIFRKRRISLTFRKIKTTPCTCKYPFFCDSQGYDPVSMKKKNIIKKQEKGKEERIDQAPKTEEEKKIMENSESHSETKPTELEKKFVYEVYDKIAPHFSHTRYKPWPKIEAFLKDLPVASLVADVGCGNGKYLNVNENIFAFGTDRSESLIGLCKTRDFSFQVFSADSLKLPLKNDTFDCVLSIAVIHHFSNKFLRQEAIKELLRITKPNGIVLIYVWAFEQEERNFTEQDIFVPWNLQYKFEDENLIQGLSENVNKKNEQGDIFVNEAKKTIVYKRYYHVFKKGELEDLIKELNLADIVESYYDHANWCVKIKKKLIIL